MPYRDIVYLLYDFLFSKNKRLKIKDKIKTTFEKDNF
jgi:hypothetical protein